MNAQIERQGPIANALNQFMRLESAGGLLLLASAVLAMIVANSPLATLYAALLDTTVAVQVGALIVSKPLLLWINDGLMAIFFFLVGLEIKREILEGELSSPAQVVNPALGAFGGIAAPAAVYAWFNAGDAVAMDGWAIPVATDIAFALGLLSVFGKRVPISLKVFLLTLAIFDDLAAIVIIAIFYSQDLSPGTLAYGLVVIGLAAVMNWRGTTRITAYVLLTVVLWIIVLKSGVHATLAGVLMAFFVPMRDSVDRSPLRELEHDLHGPVAFVILPVFAFANAGIDFSGISWADFFHPVTAGIVSGLVLGKPLGVLVMVGLGVVTGLSRLPTGMRWSQLVAVAFASGIGFTMSLFIAGLAFEHGSGDYFEGDRLGVVVGSVIAALIAGVILHFALPSESDIESE